MRVHIALRGYTSRFHRRLLRLLRSIIGKLEHPDEVAFKQAFESHSYNACLRLAIDLDIFRALMANSRLGISAVELSDKCNADAILIARIMRVVIAIGYADEVSRETYAPNRLTKSMTKPTIEACFVHSSEHAAIVSSKLAEYFKENGYHNPMDGGNGPFQYALGTEIPFFEYIHRDARKLKNFNTFQAGNRAERKSWIEWFPVEKEILRGFDPQSKNHGTVLVDMGGGTGRDITAFVQKFPQTAGYLVLEDLPGTIFSLTNLEPGIMPLAHDLFTAQPIVGAKVYYTHFLLHDFPDAKCREIISHAATAMIPVYSRLLLNETILPDTGCPAFYAAADITMMSVLAGMNRTESQWKDLLNSVGLEVARFWYSEDQTNREGVIEAFKP